MDVIDLSDESNDLPSFNEIKLSKVTDDSISVKKSVDINYPHYLSDDDFDFPEVPFACRPTTKTYSESELMFPNTFLKSTTKTYSETELIFPNAIPKSNGNVEDELRNKYLIEQPVSKATAKPLAKNKNGLSIQEKELLKFQKLKNAEETAKKKAEKVAIAQRLKCMKPGECMKYIKLIMDSSFQELNFFENLMTELQGYELEYQLESQIIPKSITWKMKLQENDINLDGCSKRQFTNDENQILIMWDCVEAVKRVADFTFVTSLISIESLMPGNMTLVIYGIQNYFKYHNNAKKRNIANECQDGMRTIPKRQKNKVFDDLPKISKAELELCLTEIQLRINCNSQLIETPHQLGLLINQYTKAIAEAPYKKQKRQATQNELDWYSVSDSKETVKIDKNGNGRKRLWQQQLCQFNLAKLETAEAIISQYPTPLHLMEAYANCTRSEGEKLVQDIAIRRTAGPLTAIRRIGPELSKKLYLMFTTEDGDILLGNDLE